MSLFRRFTLYLLALLLPGAACAATPLTGALGLTDFANADAKVVDAALYTPTVWYSSYFGGSGYTYVTDIKVSAAGEIFLVGYTDSTDLPATPGNPGTAYFGGNSDGFIAKFNADMRTLAWLKYVGTASDDRVTAVALDPSGNAFVSGYTFTPPFEIADAFVGKFVYSGSDVVATYATFGGPNSIDGTGDDKAMDITVGTSGNVIVVGSTSSTNFPNTSGTVRGGYDGFVRRYNNSLGLLSSALVDHESNADTIEAIDIGPDGKLWVVGASSFLGEDHVLAAQLNNTGTNVLWTQVFYGNGEETAYDVRVGNGGDAWMVGSTTSSDFFFGAVPDNSFGGPQDGFLAHLQPNGGLDYCSYLGGPGRQRARSVDIAPNGDIVVAGVTQPFDNLESIEAFVLRANAPAFTSFDYSKPSVHRGFRTWSIRSPCAAILFR